MNELKLTLYICMFMFFCFFSIIFLIALEDNNLIKLRKIEAKENILAECIQAGNDTEHCQKLVEKEF